MADEADAASFACRIFQNRFKLAMARGNCKVALWIHCEITILVASRANRNVDDPWGCLEHVEQHHQMAIYTDFVIVFHLTRLSSANGRDRNRTGRST